MDADVAERTVDDGVGADDEGLFVAILRVIAASQAEIGRHHDHPVLFLLLRVGFLGLLSLIRFICAYQQNTLHELRLLIEHFAQILPHLPPILRVPINLQQILADRRHVRRRRVILTRVRLLDQRIQRIQQVLSNPLRITPIPSRSQRSD